MGSYLYSMLPGCVAVCVSQRTRYFTGVATLGKGNVMVVADTERRREA
jgi:hypothetical protein